MSTTAGQKVYSDRKYATVKTVTHAGRLISVALDQEGRFWYSILSFDRRATAAAGANTQQVPNAESISDAQCWNDHPRELSFPYEVVEAGAEAAPPLTLDIYGQSNVVIPLGATRQNFPENLIDQYRSTTACLSPRPTTDDRELFKLVSDGTYLYLFRQSGDGSQTEGGIMHDVLRNTILCDRFVVLGDLITNKIETRFQRSRLYSALGAKDVKSTTDMNGVPFVEPTMILTFMRNVRHGNFTVLRTPVSDSKSYRWLFFVNHEFRDVRTARPQDLARLDYYLVDVAVDGRFNFRGNVRYTCNNEDHDKVYAIEPGQCTAITSEQWKCNRRLVPIQSDKPNSQSCFRSSSLMKAQPYLEFPKDIVVGDTGTTLELWLAPFTPSSQQSAARRWQLIQDMLDKKRVVSDYAAMQRQLKDLGAPLLLPGGSGAEEGDEVPDKGTTSGDGQTSTDKPPASPLDGCYILWARNESKPAARLTALALRFNPERNRFVLISLSWQKDASDLTIDNVGKLELVPDRWNHLAVTLSKTKDATGVGLKPIINGLPDQVMTLKGSLGWNRFGHVGGLSASVFCGNVDEMRLWNPTFDSHAIAERMFHRALGTEDGLAAYWRFDEGAGEACYDMTGQFGTLAVRAFDASKPTEEHAVLDPLQPCWTPSQAPILQPSGLWHAALHFPAIVPQGGMDAIIYYEQVPPSPQAEGSASPSALGASKRLGHVLLAFRACPATQWSGAESKFCLAIFDFDLSTDGALAQSVVWEKELSDDMIFCAKGFETWRATIQADANGTIVPAADLDALRQRVGQPFAEQLDLHTLNTDARGLSVRGRMIDDPAAIAACSPSLIESGNGEVHVYIETENVFSKIKATHLWQLRTGYEYHPVPLSLVSGRTGITLEPVLQEMETLVVSVDELPGFDPAQVLSVTITCRTDKDTTVTEIWDGLPADPVLFTLLLNGVLPAVVELGDLTATHQFEAQEDAELSAIAAAAMKSANPSPYPGLYNINLTTALSNKLAAGSFVVAAHENKKDRLGFLVASDAARGDKTILALTNDAAKVAAAPSGKWTLSVDWDGYFDIWDAVNKPSRSGRLGGSLLISAASIGANIDSAGAKALVAPQRASWTLRNVQPRISYGQRHTAVRMQDGGARLISTAPTQGVQAGTGLSAQVWCRPQAAASERGYEVVLTGAQEVQLGDPFNKALQSFYVALRGTADVDSGFAVLTQPWEADIAMPDYMLGLTFDVWFACGHTDLTFTLGSQVSIVVSGSTYDGNARWTLKVAGSPDMSAELGPSQQVWRNLALIWDRDNTPTIAIDGQIRAMGLRTTLRPADVLQNAPEAAKTLRVECFGPVPMLADMRLWTRAWTRTECRQMPFQMSHQPAPFLQGCWAVGSDLIYRDCSGHQPDTPRYPAYRFTAQDDPINVSFRTRPVEVHALLNGKAIQFKEHLQTGAGATWRHIAVTLRQAFALRFEGASYVSVPSSATLDLGDELSIGVVVSVSHRSEMLIVSKSETPLCCRADSTPVLPVSYEISVSPDGKPRFAYADAQGKYSELVSSVVLDLNRSYRISATRQIIVPKDGDMDLSDPHHMKIPPKKYAVILSVVPADDQNLGNAKSDSATLEGAEMGTSKGSLLMGGSEKDGKRLFGELSDLRIFSRALPVDRIFGEGGTALTARFAFGEGSGTAISDASNALTGKINGPALWTFSSDLSQSEIKAYLDGAPAAFDLEAPVVVLIDDARPDRSLAIGGPSQKQADASLSTLRADLAEVRLHNFPMSSEMINDCLYGPLGDTEPGLIAYFDMDMPRLALLSAPAFRNISAEHVLEDLSLNGWHLQYDAAATQGRQPLLQASPVGCDPPFIAPSADSDGEASRSECPMVVSEYAELDTVSMQGAYKRCYSFVQDEKWILHMGYKVGVVEAEWMSQVQTDPEIVGYIEGAPPLPGENFFDRQIRECHPMSSVRLVTNSKQTFTRISRGESGSSFSLYNDTGIGASWEVSAGIMIMSRETKGTVKGHVKANLEMSEARVANTTEMTSENRGDDLRAEMTGQWESNNGRYLFNNEGLVLVESNTADVYALRLRMKSKRPLVAYQVVPNPDIPKDFNIMSVPLNKRYVKQGCLDGKNGLVPDDDFPFDAMGARTDASYFRPKEAYTMKKKIQEARDAYFQGQDTSFATDHGLFDSVHDADKVGAQVSSVNAVRAQLAETIKSGLPSNREICNEYVWSAHAGVYSQTNELVDMVQTEVGGTSNYRFVFGGGINADVVIGQAAVSEQLDVMGGWHSTLTRLKDSSSEWVMQLLCDINPAMDIRTRDASTTELHKKEGAVDAYRFMTFYREPSQENYDVLFNTVIDPEWLRSADSNALSLAALKAKGSGPRCFRVCHRVTFVSRVLPKVPANPSEQDAGGLETQLPKLNIESNWQLLQTLLPHVGMAHDRKDVRELIYPYLKATYPTLTTSPKCLEEVIDLIATFKGLE
ncbi:hypothetical protein OC844_000238 [Tilletia horrida]|nr:hypothetical protein OC844_000238 [Tilletia horrida]